VNGWLNVTFDRLSPALHLALVATIIASIAMVFLFPLL
jgi:hypothetical protein